jgi:hypothetical protein
VRQFAKALVARLRQRGYGVRTIQGTLLHDGAFQFSDTAPDMFPEETPPA